MGIGTVEIAFLLVVAVAAVMATVVFRQRETLVLAAFCVIAVAVSPADLASTLLIAAPNCVLYLCATRYRSIQTDRHAKSAG